MTSSAQKIMPNIYHILSIPLGGTRGPLRGGIKRMVLGPSWVGGGDYSLSTTALTLPVLLALNDKLEVHCKLLVCGKCMDWRLLLSNPEYNRMLATFIKTTRKGYIFGLNHTRGRPKITEVYVFFTALHEVL